MKLRCVKKCSLLLLIVVACTAVATGSNAASSLKPEINMRLPSQIRQPRLLNRPSPTDDYMHAEVATGEGYLLVFDNTLLLGNAIGRLLDGEVTTVQIYTQDVAKIIGSSVELNGGYVRLSMLKEIPDENSFPEGDPYQAVIIPDPTIQGSVDVWKYFYLTGEKVGTVTPGEVVIAQNYDCGYSAEIILSSGLQGFVAIDYLNYAGSYTGD